MQTYVRSSAPPRTFLKTFTHLFAQKLLHPHVCAHARTQAHYRNQILIYLAFFNLKHPWFKFPRFLTMVFFLSKILCGQFRVDLLKFI